ncbi:hypothetical protein ACHWQZ_G013942 [Mnemiopsis leidyi]
MLWGTMLWGRRTGTVPVSGTGPSKWDWSQLVGLVPPDIRSVPKPAISVKNFVKNKSNQNETFEFKLTVAKKKPLNETEVYLWKIVEGDKGQPDFKPTNFEISLKNLSEEEVKQWEDERKSEGGQGFPHVIEGRGDFSTVSREN